jgi:hypothetical protein
MAGSLTRRDPRRASSGKNSVQKVPVSEGPISRPSTSRRPSLPPQPSNAPTTDGPAVQKSSFRVVMATREGCLPLLTLSGMVIGEARQIQVFEQHRRMMSASVGLGSGGDGYCHAFDF